jgi:hypothetical protein
MDALCPHGLRVRVGLFLSALATLPFLMGAKAQTRNFVVDARTPQIAQQVALRAEKCRAEIAIAWLGHPLPDWPRPCPIQVQLTDGEAGGLTSFNFHQGRVTDQIMKVEGRLDRILASAIPHEITHTIFAHFLGSPMPRWADEGASLLSEDERELARHDRIVDDLFSRRGEFPLAKLFTMENYPKDLIGFYGQGYSIARFLIEIGGRPRFLEFVRDALEADWDSAIEQHYQLANVGELERAWLAWRRVGDPSDHHRVLLSLATGLAQPRAGSSRPRTDPFATPRNPADGTPSGSINER